MRIAALAGVAVAAAAAFAWFRPGPTDEPLPPLTLVPGQAPLISFEARSQLDPGVVRLLLRVEQPDLGPLRRRVGRAVTAAFDALAGASARDPVPFTEVWEHENVIEVRIPLVEPAERDRWIECRVDSIDEPFRLRPSDLPSPEVDVRQIDALSDGSVSIAMVNRSASTLAVDGVRVDGREVEASRAIELPAYGSARLRVRDVAPPGNNVSVVLSAGGRWLQAHEVARAPAFALLDWGEFADRAEDGRAMAQVKVDVCNVEAERGLPAGAYLSDMRKLIDDAVADLPSDARAGRPHAFLFLNDGGRPISHFIYGRLADYVGVTALDPRLATADLRDVAFWLRMDREAVEPRHVLVLPGVLARNSPVDARLDARELRRLVLAALSIGPRGLAPYWPENDPAVVHPADDPGYASAMDAIEADIGPLAPLLQAALPVPWVVRGTAEGWVGDRYGTTGCFALWTADDRLVLIDLGYGERAGLSLPSGVRLAERLSGTIDLVESPSDGAFEMRTARPESPEVAVYRLEVDRVRDGRLEWRTY